MKTFARTSSRRAWAAAGAACLLLSALTAATPQRTPTRRPARQQKTRSQSAAPETPVSLGELLKSLGTRGLKAGKLIEELEARGVAFEMTAGNEAQLVKAGASPEVIAAARSNYRPAQKDSAPTQQASAPMLPAVVSLPDPEPFTHDPWRAPYGPPEMGVGLGLGPGIGPGRGGGMGMGAGTGGGVGAGEGGVGYGPGRGGNTGGGDGGGFGGEVDYSRPFKPGEVTRKAVITAKPEPGFTEEARRNGVHGVVRLRAILSASGSVQGISVVKGLPDGLTEKAIAAAKQIRFTPAQRDGRKVSQYVTLEYYFPSLFDEKEVTRNAVILEKPAPEYTAEARRNGVSGKVILKVLLWSNGEVWVTSVVQGLPDGLTDKAFEAAQRIKFTPAEVNGRAVIQAVTIEYDFKP